MEQTTLSRLRVGDTFTIPGDERIWRVRRFSLASVTIRPEPGSGETYSFRSEGRDEVTIEQRSSMAVSLNTLVYPVEAV